MKGGSKQFEYPKDPGTTGASYGARTMFIILTYSNSFSNKCHSLTGWTVL